MKEQNCIGCVMWPSEWHLLLTQFLVVYYFYYVFLNVFFWSCSKRYFVKIHTRLFVFKTSSLQMAPRIRSSSFLQDFVENGFVFLLEAEITLYKTNQLKKFGYCTKKGCFSCRHSDRRFLLKKYRFLSNTYR